MAVITETATTVERMDDRTTRNALFMAHLCKQMRGL
jgi:hypothetical protein